MLEQITASNIPAKKEDILQKIPVVTIKQGERLYRVNEPATHAIYLKEGIVFIGFQSETDENKIYYAEVVRAPSLIGEDAILKEADEYPYRRSFSQAITKCEIQHIPPYVLNTISTIEPDLYLTFFLQFIKRAGNLQSRRNRMSHDHNSRIMSAIVDLESVKLSPEEFQITQKMISEFEGISRTYVNGVVTKMYRTGKLQEGQVSVYNNPRNCK